MPFAQMTSIRTRLMFAVLFVVALSWLVGNALVSYITYHRISSIRQEMLARPDLYPMPIPEPRFGIADLLFGPRVDLRPPPPPLRLGPPPFRPLERPGPPPPGERNTAASDLLFIRVITTLVLALLAGMWLTRRFSQPLVELTRGARAFKAGNLKYRVPVTGDDEFSTVATAMNDMAERVAEQIESLKEDARRRRHFLADVAHELRSPVTTLRTMAGALKDGTADDPERRERAVDSLARVSDRLHRLVTELLELARLDLKELPIHPRSVDLRELAVTAVGAHSAAAARAGITLHPVCGDSTFVSADPERIAQVLDNLLDNAISYAGAEAEVRVSVQGGRIVVADTGLGISAKHLPNLFEPFYRVDTTRTPGDPHSGLGLRIARGLVEAHGGTLSLESEEGRGTTVTVSLPDIQATGGRGAGQGRPVRPSPPR
ncbi:MAG: sensor histidine kinase [Armatimonadota bacterium]